MILVENEGQIRLMDGDDLVGEAMPDTLDIVIPTGPDFDAAVAASRSYAGFEAHPFPTCFVCRPERSRATGSASSPGISTVRRWSPPHGPPMSRWAVPQAWSSAVMSGPPSIARRISASRALPMALLGRLTARIDRLPEVGERLVVIGWPMGAEGRKHFAGSALLDADGHDIASAQAVPVCL